MKRKLSDESSISRSYLKLVTKFAKSNGYRKSDIKKSVAAMDILHLDDAVEQHTCMLFRTEADINSIPALIQKGLANGDELEFILAVKKSYLNDNSESFWKSIQTIENNYFIFYRIIADKDWKP